MEKVYKKRYTHSGKEFHVYVWVSGDSYYFSSDVRMSGDMGASALQGSFKEHLSTYLDEVKYQLDNPLEKDLLLEGFSRIKPEVVKSEDDKVIEYDILNFRPVDGKFIEVELSSLPKLGSVLTFDAMYGDQYMVANTLSDGRCILMLSSNNSEDTFNVDEFKGRKPLLLVCEMTL